MILPHNIDLEQSQKYRLSIRLTPNGFSFLIFSSKDPSLYFYKDVEFNNTLSYIENIKKVFFEVNFFVQPYKKIIITKVSPRYTLVPDTFYEKAKVKELFEFNFNDKSGEIISTSLDNQSLHLLFDIDKELYSFLFRNLWNPSFVSFTTYLHHQFSTYQIEKFEKRCFVDFHDNMITIICFNKDQLLVAKTFQTEERYDAIYNIVNIWEKLNLNQNEDALFISGNLEDNKESVETLRQLIKNSLVVDFSCKQIDSESFTSLPTDIIIQLCE